MSDTPRTEQLLAEILETQRAHLDAYQRVTAQSLELQRQGVDTQGRHVLLYRRVLFALAAVLAGLVAYIAWLTQRVY